MFYATGLGPVDASGRLTDSFDVYLGERKGQISSAAPISGLPGVYQVQVTAPTFLATDRLYVLSGGWQSNIVDVLIRAGSNTANVSGAIYGLYPSSNPFFTLPMCTSDDPNAPPCSSGQDLGVMLHAGSSAWRLIFSPARVSSTSPPLVTQAASLSPSIQRAGILPQLPCLRPPLGPAIFSILSCPCGITYLAARCRRCACPSRPT